MVQNSEETLLPVALIKDSLMQDGGITVVYNWWFLGSIFFLLNTLINIKEWLQICVWGELPYISESNKEPI